MRRLNFNFAITALALMSLLVGGCKKKEETDEAAAAKTTAAKEEHASANKPAVAAPAGKANAAPVVVKVDPTAAKSAKNAKNLISGLLGGLAKASAQATGQKPLGPVVNWRKLIPFLPDAIGAFKASGDAKGETGGIGGLSASTVRRSYKADKKVLQVKIADTAAVPMMRTAFGMARLAHKDSSDGLQKGVDVAGFPGVLEWNKARARSKIAVLVGGRYLTELWVKPSANADDVLALIKTMDLKKLAAVKAPAAK